MKVTKLKQELNQLNLDQLKEKLDSAGRELFSLRLNSATAHVKDYSQFRKFRKQIARIQTIIQQK